MSTNNETLHISHRSYLKGGGNGTMHTPKRKHVNWRRLLFIVAMMAIPTLFGIVFDLYMKLDTISLMFRDLDGTFGFYYIQRALESEGTWKALYYFFLVFIVFNFLCMPMQIAISYFFSRKIPGTMFFRVLFYIPTLFSSVVTGALFKQMMDNTYGVVPYLLRGIGVQFSTIGLLDDPTTAFSMIIVYLIWIGMGSSCLIFTAAINKISPEIFEAGRIDGTNLRQEFWHVVIPMISPIISVGFLNNTVSGFGLYSEVLLLTNPSISGVMTVSYIINEAALQLRYYESAATGFIFTVIAIPVVSGLRAAFDKWLPDVSS